jgi:hypothetical protein
MLFYLYMLSFLSVKHLGVELLGHRVELHKSFAFNLIAMPGKAQKSSS